MELKVNFSNIKIWAISNFLDNLTWSALKCSLKGRVVVITGSAQGLGKAFAKRLLQGGARVTITNIIAIMIIVSI